MNKPCRYPLRYQAVLRILLIDDSEEYRRFLTALLMGSYGDLIVDGYNPSELGIPGRDFNWQDYTLVLLDYNLGLPDENGIDWLGKIVGYGVAPPVIMLSGMDDSALARESLRTGAYNFLLKKEITAANIMLKLAESLVDRDRILQQLSESPAKTVSKPVSQRPQVHKSPLPSRTPGGMVPDWDNSQIPVAVLYEQGYEVIKIVGKGAMSTVLLARDVKGDKEVVLKIYYTRGQKDPLTLLRFMQEYEIISNLAHANVVSIYKRAFTKDFAYIVMEYLAGGDLKQRIARGLTPEQSLRLLRQLAAGLEVIHGNEIIHRDLKPANILFRDEEHLVITDFGIAKVLSQELADITLTNQLVIGTPYYMSPEQARGVEVDKRTDIYSVGVIFFHMLAGKRPYSGTTVTQLVHAHINDPIPRLPEHLAGYQTLVDGLMAKDPAERIQNAHELLVGIDRIS